ncbi:hypothetical protein DFP74_3256 [Nocardiopsis sp. Huas11]|uniref:hypothetical protein n=1 Tax=Nocardiopsis sp. Huas11 TaxID=2183912 RepID=UPI000EB2FE9C|nr:hypothetical protein [Nocardiopsis sp. Huas11]RKS07578.1 hypothetical protein DFP74_3256 [Nocardiopsis sp. Huas11]
MEADLARYYRIELADLWRGRLSLRRLAVLIRHLPVDSATMTALGGDGWTLSHYLQADMVHASTGQPHPADPRVRRAKEEKEARLAEAKRRADQRREELAAADPCPS